MNNTPHLNGSSISPTPSLSPEPEPVGNLPQADIRIYEQPEERVPTPFPGAQPTLSPGPYIFQPSASTFEPSTSGEPIWSGQASTSGQPLTTGQPSSSGQLSTSDHSCTSGPSTSTAPTGHRTINSQPSSSGSSSPSVAVPNPLTPIVNINNPHPALSGSSSHTSSFQAVEHLIRRLREDRRRNEESRARSVASGLYQFANMVMPRLPEYEAPIYDDFEFEEDLEQRSRGTRRRYRWHLTLATGFIGMALLGHQLGSLYYYWK